MQAGHCSVSSTKCGTHQGISVVLNVSSFLQGVDTARGLLPRMTLLAKHSRMNQM